MSNFVFDNLILNSISFKDHFAGREMDAMIDFCFDGIRYKIECQGPSEWVQEKVRAAVMRITGRDMVRQFAQTTTLEMWTAEPQALPGP
jgi:hypothetical protein